MIRIKESEMMNEFIAELQDLSPVDFVEAHNQMFNTGLTINEIVWDGTDDTFERQ